MRFFLLLFVVSILTLRSNANAQETLRSDLSRGQLFAKYILSASPGGGEVLSLDRDFVFPNDVQRLASSGQPNVIGIDVSHHNTDGCLCEIDWAQMFDAGARFVYAKASQGSGIDPRLQAYLKGIDAVPIEKRLYKGAYHFLSADGRGDKEGQFFIDNLSKQLADIGSNLQDLDLPPVVDLEWDHRVDRRGRPVACSDGKVHRDCWELVPPNEIVARVEAWLERVRKLTGREPLVYTARSWVVERIRDQEKFAKINAKVWIADYVQHDRTGLRTILTVNPRVPNGVITSLWQFSDRAQTPEPVNLDGVDANIFRGSIENFRAAFRVPR